MLKLIDLIHLADIEMESFKIHCATGKDPTPLEAFFDGTFKEWQEWQTQRNFQYPQVLSLIYLGNSRWLFAGLYNVHGVRRARRDGRNMYRYKTSETDGLGHLTGRVIVPFKRGFRASYLIGHKFIDELLVSELLPKRMTIGNFPGFHSVLLSRKLLRTIVREELPSWKSALGSVAGIYIVTDTKTGKIYVGSASGGGGIWQRWVSYAKNGHGGNKELKALLERKGNAYSKYFQFAILEACESNASDDYIQGREAYWKNVLCSRQFGYNSN